MEGGCAEGQIETADTVEPLSAQLAGFRGSVFVKGSRRHALEKALVGRSRAQPAWLRHASCPRSRCRLGYRRVAGVCSKLGVAVYSQWDQISVTEQAYLVV